MGQEEWKRRNEEGNEKKEKRRQLGDRYIAAQITRKQLGQTSHKSAVDIVTERSRLPAAWANIMVPETVVAAIAFVATAYPRSLREALRTVRPLRLESEGFASISRSDDVSPTFGTPGGTTER